jgi:hypothetical protein
LDVTRSVLHGDERAAAVRQASFLLRQSSPHIEHVVVLDVVEGLRGGIDLIVEFGAGKAGDLIDVCPLLR